MTLTLKVLIQSITCQSGTTVHHAPLYQVQFQLLQWFVQPLLWPWPWKCQSSLFPWQSGTTEHHHTTFGSNSFCGLDSITQILPISLHTKHIFNTLKLFSNFIGFFFFLEIAVKLTWMLWSKSQVSMQFYLHVIHLFTMRNKMICWKVMHSICHKQPQKWSLENGKYNVTYMAYCDKANMSVLRHLSSLSPSHTHTHTHTHTHMHAHVHALATSHAHMCACFLSLSLSHTHT